MDTTVSTSGVDSGPGVLVVTSSLVAMGLSFFDWGTLDQIRYPKPSSKGIAAAIAHQ